MEPHNNNLGAASELPQPQEAGVMYGAPEQIPAAPEQQIAPAGVSQPASTQTMSATNPFAPATVPPTTVPPTSSSQLTQQLVADDADLIEKEWVIKAKAIVMHTKNDPHLQNIEMSKVKADYLKKRYNKNLKINEG